MLRGRRAFICDAFLHEATNESLIGGFVGSPEYFLAAGKGSARTWFDAVNQDVLHRTPTAGDEAYWLSVLQ